MTILSLVRLLHEGAFIELILMGRIQTIGLGSGGPGSGYGLLQVHYRL